MPAVFYPGLVYDRSIISVLQVCYLSVMYFIHKSMCGPMLGNGDAGEFNAALSGIVFV